MDNYQLLNKLREYLLKNLGLSFSVNRNAELYSKMGEACKEFNFNDADRFIEWLLNKTLDKSQVEKLASFITIGETYFLREKKALDYLEHEYLPRLIKERKGKHQYIKIWSAGCSSGEEAYSVAIMLKRLIPNLQEWDITLMATDINPKFLEKAKKGEYTEWSFRGIGDSFKRIYFDRYGKEKYIIKKEIREMVDFSFLNLIDCDFCSQENNINMFDIILCRNVMIYFSKEGIRKVTSKFYDSLKKGGVLILSAVESSHLICPKFFKSLKDGFTVYKKYSPDEKRENSIIEANYRQKYKSIIIQSNINNTQNKKVNYRSNKTALGRNLGKLQKSKSGNNEKKSLRSEFDELLMQYNAGFIDKVDKRINSLLDNNKDFRFYLLLSKIKADKMMLSEAEKLCVKAIEMNKVNPDSYYLLANILIEQNREQEAIDSLNKSLFLDPNYVLSYFMLGNIYKEMGNNEDSKRHFNNAKKSLSNLDSNERLIDFEDISVGKLSSTISAYLY